MYNIDLSSQKRHHSYPSLYSSQKAIARDIEESQSPTSVTIFDLQLSRTVFRIELHGGVVVTW